MASERSLQQTGELLKAVGDYYSEKLVTHGETAKGVDWSTEESQKLRFHELSRVIDFDKSFTINDLGCGYGAYFNYLASRVANFQYFGIDVSSPMIEAAKRRLADRENAQFLCGGVPEAVMDYTVASGIFNVRLHHSEQDWRDYFLSTIEMMNAKSKAGFSFNCLTSYSDADRMRADLFYPNPGEIFDFCKRKFSRHVALLHDYGLYEFTILVRKSI